MKPVLMPVDASREREFLTMQVTDVRDEAERIRSFELRDPGGADLPVFDAGAHLAVEVGLAHGRPALRPYSLLGDPRDRSRYQIAVLLQPEGRGGSRFMHERVAPGTMLRVDVPVNGFPLHEAEHTILIAGGIGITPILAMIRVLTSQRRSYELHYAARSQTRMAFRAALEALAGERAHFYLSDVGPRRPADIMPQLATATPGAHLYVCGPPRLIRAVRSGGQRAGWPQSRIHVESFGPARDGADRAVEVHLERSGLTLQVAAEDTVLDAVLRAGVWAPYECRRGACGACMTRVIEGAPDHRDVFLSPELQAQYMCTCVSRARSDRLTLDL